MSINYLTLVNIERYQKSKEAITGISEEPWRFRYVGMPHSVRISENGLALEEYVQTTKGMESTGKGQIWKKINTA